MSAFLVSAEMRIVMVVREPGVAGRGGRPVRMALSLLLLEMLIPSSSRFVYFAYGVSRSTQKIDAAGAKTGMY
jgi:hypothetical protein